MLNGTNDIWQEANIKSFDIDATDKEKDKIAL
jgi:hypothetical protein